ncbi:DUF6538 domain-containing protein [Ruegeria sp. HKCCA0370]|uniref:DUF6538 domain-containing protein n=1 Tax=Ruegeria sp. HKCCA0370 TaxID=2682995 RepID=UPI0020C47574|nr:DUF6538 domain-containing protein [Ruegeria sp. HKCCA0370]
MSETISRPFTFIKDGVFYFSRRIPKELRNHYTSPRITYSLRTKSPKIAEARARRAADQLDEYWYHLRCRDAKLPESSFTEVGMNNGLPEAELPETFDGDQFRVLLAAESIRQVSTSPCCKPCMS